MAFRLSSFWLLATFTFFLVSRSTLADSEKPEKKLSEIHFKIQADEGQLAPSAFPVKMDPEVCGKTRSPQSFITDQKRHLSNVVIWLEGGRLASWSQAQTSDASEVITEEGCEFNPRVSIIPQNGMVTFINRDKILYGIRSKSQINPPSYRAHPPNLHQIQVRFEKPEIVPIVCDFHPWMKAFVVVAPHAAYAVTNQAGEGVIKRIPEGTYKVHLWHETLGFREMEKPISVVGKSVSIDFKWTSLQQ